MIELDPLKLTLFLFIAAAFGALAYALVNRTRPVRRIDLPTSYFRGLNYLLNEQQDKAIEVFLKLAESDKNALETQLALGHLFRRRGEVDRAIRLHQGLVTKASLSAEERGRAVLALGEDYMRAGLYDRAETLLQDALKVPAVAPLASLHLITIYQAERDWLQAIEHAKRYESLVGQSMGRQIGHFYCELAEQARHVRDFTACRSYIADAYRYDSHSVRAGMLEGEVERDSGNLAAAMRAFERAVRHDIEFLPEVMPALLNCYEQLGEQSRTKSFLTEVSEKYPGLAPVLAMCERIEASEGPREAAELLSSYLRAHPSIRGLAALLRFMLKQEQPQLAALTDLKSVVDHLSAKAAGFRCGNCGFGAKAHHWQCPGCKQWGQIKRSSD